MAVKSIIQLLITTNSSTQAIIIIISDTQLPDTPMALLCTPRAFALPSSTPLARAFTSIAVAVKPSHQSRHLQTRRSPSLCNGNQSQAQPSPPLHNREIKKLQEEKEEKKPAEERKKEE
jgi:hypothetical protein